MEYVADLGGIVTGFTVTQNEIDCICGKELLKIEKQSGNIIHRKAIFEKDGLSRKLAADNGQIFIYDFCTLYIFCQENFELLGKWQLGNDLSSDICGMAVDADTVYCSIRNGKMITLDRHIFSIKEFPVSDSSMWSVRVYGKYLICGTVGGKLLLLDKAALSIEKDIILGKQNIGSTCIDREVLYAAGQDKKLSKVNLHRFEVEKFRKSAHRKMFDCIGIYEDILVTVSYPCSEIILWNKETLEKRKEINIPLRLSGRTWMENDLLYITSRNIQGIAIIRLNAETG